MRPIDVFVDCQPGIPLSELPLNKLSAGTEKTEMPSWPLGVPMKLTAVKSNLYYAKTQDTTLGINPEIIRHDITALKPSNIGELGLRVGIEHMTRAQTVNNNCATKKNGALLREISNSGAATRGVGCCLLEPLAVICVHK
jgi:hypothetical protein